MYTRVGVGITSLVQCLGHLHCAEGSPKKDVQSPSSQVLKRELSLSSRSSYQLRDTIQEREERSLTEGDT